MKNTIRIDHGTEANMVHDIHCTDVTVIRDTQAVDQRYTRIGLIILGLIDIKQNHEQKLKIFVDRMKLIQIKKTKKLH